MSKKTYTKYPGVYYIEVIPKIKKHEDDKKCNTEVKGKKEKVYYIKYYKNKRRVDEKAGYELRDDMSASKAANIRYDKIQGKLLTNKEEREKKQAEKLAKQNKWTVDRLWSEYKSQKEESHSLKAEDGRFNNYLKEPFGQKEPHEIIQIEVDKLRTELGKKLKPQTVKHILALLKRIVNFGFNKQLSDNLSFKIQMPKVDNVKTEDLTKEQLNKLLKILFEYKNKNAANFMLMAYFTGLRRGELYRLQWEHINYEKRFIKIVEPKGGKSQTIPLNKSTEELLNSHPKIDKSPFVFLNETGGLKDNILKAIKDIREKADLPKDFRPLHGLRHVFASMLASSGKVDMYTLQKLLTHKSPQMTQRYAHLHDAALKNAANVTDDIINQNIDDDTEDNKVIDIIHL